MQGPRWRLVKCACERDDFYSTQPWNPVISLKLQMARLQPYFSPLGLAGISGFWVYSGLDLCSGQSPAPFGHCVSHGLGGLSAVCLPLFGDVDLFAARLPITAVPIFLSMASRHSGSAFADQSPGSFKRTPGTFKRTPGSFQSVATLP